MLAAFCPAIHAYEPYRQPAHPPLVPIAQHLFPSARTYCYMPGEAKFDSQYREDERRSVVDFWVNHFDVVIAAAPIEWVREAKPTIMHFNYDIATALYEYNPDNDTYKYSMLNLKNWVDSHYSELGFSTPAAALEDCFLHAKVAMTIRFTDRSRGASRDVPAYDPANPRLSRIPACWQNNNDYCMNIKSLAYQRFWTEHQLKSSTMDHDGVMLDSHNFPNDKVKPEQVVELTTAAQYQADLQQFTQDLRTAMNSLSPKKYLGMNSYRYSAQGEFEFIDSFDFILREASYGYYIGSSAVENLFKSATNAGDRGVMILLQHNEGFGEVFSGSAPDFTYKSLDSALDRQGHLDRDRITGLAGYYLALHGPVYYCAYPGTHHGRDKRLTSWFDAIAYDIGAPLQYGFSTEWAGNDPSWPVQNGSEFTTQYDNLKKQYPQFEYKVFSRRFEKALVLFRARTNSCTEIYDSRSATTHPLDGWYRPLKADGTVGAPINTITLKNWEGAILIKAEGPTADTFATWVTANFTTTEQANTAITGPAADPDGAGLSNLARYAFGLPARGRVANPITPGTTTVGTGTFLTLTFPRRTAAEGLTYTLESSTDLATWVTVPDRTYTAGSGPITARDAVAIGTANPPRRFLRLRITQP
jgi:hypothetical protein